MFFLFVSLLQVGGVPAGQIAVYEEFARSIPGFLPTPEANQPPGFLAKPMQVTGGKVSIRWLSLNLSLLWTMWWLISYIVLCCFDFD